MSLDPMGVFCSSAVRLSLFAFLTAHLIASPHMQERLERAHAAFLEDRRQALLSLSDPFGVPPTARVVIEQPNDKIREKTTWKRNVLATTFYVGEMASETNPIAKDKSAWDLHWVANFGGIDDPIQRVGWNPKGFVPKQTPFYVALPYNDILTDGLHRPEASEVIPWFWQSYRGDGISVCKGRWVAIHLAGKVCYAKWEDVGPVEVDHWRYVFGGEAPRKNAKGGSGIDVSPAVRDYLGLKKGQRIQWRFLNDRDVPEGPWRKWK